MPDAGAGRRKPLICGYQCRCEPEVGLRDDKGALVNLLELKNRYGGSQ